ncbi:hypothetical protein B0H14DRAFT_2604265 [Mycena olivaceomarginata]|nr:hypothetical protein B0H14DRAFT_2604265 [Mycena olivaceomarginata]
MPASNPHPMPFGRRGVVFHPGDRERTASAVHCDSNFGSERGGDLGALDAADFAPREHWYHTSSPKNSSSSHWNRGQWRPESSLSFLIPTTKKLMANIRPIWMPISGQYFSNRAQYTLYWPDIRCHLFGSNSGGAPPERSRMKVTWLSGSSLKQGGDSGRTGHTEGGDLENLWGAISTGRGRREGSASGGGGGRKKEMSYDIKDLPTIYAYYWDGEWGG